MVTNRNKFFIYLFFFMAEFSFIFVNSNILDVKMNLDGMWVKTENIITF